MDKRFRLPALLIILTPIAIIVWYYLNTDIMGTMLFGEKLDHCGVIACEVTRNRFFPVAITLGVVFLIGIVLLAWRTWTGGKNAKN